MPSDSPTAVRSLFYRDALVAEIGALRVMYEPRPTPWFGQSADEQAVTTEQWVQILAAAGLGIDEFRLAWSTWAASDAGDRFPAPRDLLALAARAKRGEVRPVPADRMMCNGTGWRQKGDETVPCGRCSPALAAVWADPAKYARWKDGALLSDLDVGVEERKGMQRYIIPLRLEKPCSAASEESCPPARGLEIARAAYAAECEAQGRPPSWTHFATMIEAIAGRANVAAPVE